MWIRIITPPSFRGVFDVRTRCSVIPTRPDYYIRHFVQFEPLRCNYLTSQIPTFAIAIIGLVGERGRQIKRAPQLNVNNRKHIQITPITS